MAMPDVKTVREYSAIGMLVLQMLIVPILGWTAIAVSNLTGQVALLQAQMSDIRDGGVYTPVQASKAHERIDRSLNDHEQRLRTLEDARRANGRGY